MKFFIHILFLAILTSCSVQQQLPTKTTSTPPVVNSKIATLLQDSQKTNHAPTISQLIQNVMQDPNNPEPLYNLGYTHMQSSQSNDNMRITQVIQRLWIIGVLHNILYQLTYGRSMVGFLRILQ